MKKNFLLAACLLSILFSGGVSAANIIWSEFALALLLMILF